MFHKQGHQVRLDIHCGVSREGQAGCAGMRARSLLFPVVFAFSLQGVGVYNVKMRMRAFISVPASKLRVFELRFQTSKLKCLPRHGSDMLELPLSLPSPADLCTSSYSVLDVQVPRLRLVHLRFARLPRVRLQLAGLLF